MSGLRDLARCRGCLRAMGRRAQAGLCGRCWNLLSPLEDDRCPRCALAHGEGEPCPDPVAWTWGDALWDYHGGLGALLVPAIKRGEWGWKAALLRRAGRAALPRWTAGCDLVCNAPTARLRRWMRGFDLAEEAAALFAVRLGIPFRRLLRKPFYTPAQASLSEARRRRMGAHVSLEAGAEVAGRSILLVDDVWTTGTTLLRCARVLDGHGVKEVAVLALFRAGRRGGN